MTDQHSSAATLDHTSAAVPGETCARCHTTQEWGSSSWCPNCGFYPSLDSEGINDHAWKHAVPAEPTEDADSSLFSSLPGWFWIMMGGVVTILLIGFGIRTLAADEESLRGIIALTALGMAFPLVLVAHIIASHYAMKHDPRINVMDAIISWFAVWQPSIEQLPVTKRRMWCLTWGLTSMLTAVLIIGGIDYNAPFRTEQKVKTKPLANRAIQAVTGAAKAAGQGDEQADMKESLEQLNDPSMTEAAGAPAAMDKAISGMTGELPDLPDAATTEADAAEEKDTAVQTMLCVAYGVLTNSQKIPTGFLFAGRPETQYQHVAEISAADMSREDYQRLAAHLANRIQKQPAFPTSYDAVWVDPGLVCRLKYVRMNQDGTVHGPEFDDIIRDGRRRAATPSPSGRR